MYHLSDSNIIVSRRWHNAQNQQGRSCTSTGTGRFYNTNTGIALLQSINAKRFRTFGEMALDLVKNQISCFQFASVVVDIFDRYDIQNSIKKAERERRSKYVFTAKNYEVIEGRVIPDWKKFISSGENKQSLIRFLGDYIVKHINQNSSLQEGQSLYLAGLFSNPETVKMLNQNGMLDCSCLASTQEEADTRIILHALYSDKLYQEKSVQGCIVVKSPDTEVLVLYVHYFPKMKNTSELLFQTGLITSTKDCRRYIPVHELCKSVSSVVCEILPDVHALTGCDTTSSFFGIGKSLCSKL